MKKQQGIKGLRSLYTNKWKKMSKEDKDRIYQALNKLYGKDDINNATNDR